MSRIPCLPTVGTLPDKILTMTALCGELPSSELHRFPGSPSYIERTVKRLRQYNLLQVYCRNGLRGLRLTQTARKLMLDRQPDQFGSVLYTDHEHSQLKSDPARHRRTHRMAEVLMTMHNVGVSAFPWEKRTMYTCEPLETEPLICRPTYYNSYEIKEIGLASNKIRGSRAMGVLFTPQRLCPIYNIGEGIPMWGNWVEVRFKIFCEIDISMRWLPKQYFRVPITPIMFGAGMEQMPELVGAGKTRRSKCFIMRGDFEHFYYLTNDYHGEAVLQLLCDPERKQELDDILLEGYQPRDPNWRMDNDGFDSNGDPVLLGYTCDMCRIDRFYGGLELLEKKGLLYCFDFQEEAIRRICGPRLTIQCIDFEAYERELGRG